MVLLMHPNKTPIHWYNRIYNNVESSIYGSDLVGMIISTELTMEIWYKLRMLRFYIDGPSQILVDNESVVTSCSITSTTLNNNHIAISYHLGREDVEEGMTSLAHMH